MEGKEKVKWKLMEVYLIWEIEWIILLLFERESIGYKVGLGEKMINFMD